MTPLQKNIIKITNDLPYYYLQDILDYAAFLKSKAHKESDTEYLESIPNMAESILEASKEDLNNCSKSLDW